MQPIGCSAALQRLEDGLHAIQRTDRASVTPHGVQRMWHVWMQVYEVVRDMRDTIDERKRRTQRHGRMQRVEQLFFPVDVWEQVVAHMSAQQMAVAQQVCGVLHACVCSVAASRAAILGADEPPCKGITSLLHRLETQSATACRLLHQLTDRDFRRLANFERCILSMCLDAIYAHCNRKGGRSERAVRAYRLLTICARHRRTASSCRFRTWADANAAQLATSGTSAGDQRFIVVRSAALSTFFALPPDIVARHAPMLNVDVNVASVADGYFVKVMLRHLASVPSRVAASVPGIDALLRHASSRRPGVDDACIQEAAALKESLQEARGEWQVKIRAPGGATR